MTTESIVTGNQTGTLRMLLKGISYHFGRGAQGQVEDAIKKTQAAGVPLASILLALLPIVLSLFSGGKIDLQAIINAILALIPK